MFRLIAKPFGFVLKLAYMLVKNYGLALFIFTVILNLIMLPSRIKQQKESGKMAKLRPKLEQIQKKYANNREKLNEATMELYNENGVSPMGSCLPMLVTYIVLFAVIEVVYAPMSFISSVSAEKINEAQSTVVNYYYISQAVKNDIPEGAEIAPTVEERLAQGTNIEELFKGYNENLAESSGIKGVANISDEKLDEMIKAFEADPTLDQYFNDQKKVSSRLMYGNGTRSQLILLSVADRNNPGSHPELFDDEISDFCTDFDYTIFGLYLGEYPSWKTVYVIIPILSLITQLLICSCRSIS